MLAVDCLLCAVYTLKVQVCNYLWGPDLVYIIIPLEFKYTHKQDYKVYYHIRVHVSSYEAEQ